MKDAAYWVLIACIFVLGFVGCRYQLKKSADEIADHCVQLMVESYKKNLTESLERVQKRLDEEQRIRWEGEE